jgi:hypothetical protein
LLAQIKIVLTHFSPLKIILDMKFRLISLLFLSVLLLPFCTVSKKASADKKAPAITFQKDILPVMQDRCTPCHFPENGKKKFLDTYAAVTNNIDDILARVQLPVDNKEFMPFKSKKEPLSDSLIMVFKQWKEMGMPE